MHDEEQEEINFIDRKTGDLLRINEGDFREEVDYPYYLILKKKCNEQGKSLTYPEYKAHYEKTGRLTI